MTDKANSQNNIAPEAPAPKESGPAKLIGGVSWWINSLMGKPQARREAPPAPTPEPPATQGANVPKVDPTPAPLPGVQVPKTEDPIFQDLQKFKSVLGKFTGKVSKNVAPAVTKGVSSSSQAANAFVKTVDPGFIKKLLRVFLIIVVLAALAFVGFRFFRNIDDESPGGVNTATPVEGELPTPTEFVINPEQPSVYASDPVILKLGEDINVLVREIEGANIKESTLNPPRLDFNVTF